MITTSKVKKLALVLPISMLMTMTSIEVVLAMIPIIDIPVIVLSIKPPVLEKKFLPLNCVPCIYHLIQFKKNQVKFKALFDTSIEVNAIYDLSLYN